MYFSCVIKSLPGLVATIGIPFIAPYPSFWWSWIKPIHFILLCVWKVLPWIKRFTNYVNVHFIKCLFNVPRTLNNMLLMFNSINIPSSESIKNIFIQFIPLKCLFFRVFNIYLSISVHTSTKKHPKWNILPSICCEYKW